MQAFPVKHVVFCVTSVVLVVLKHLVQNGVGEVRSVSVHTSDRPFQNMVCNPMICLQLSLIKKHETTLVLLNMSTV